MSRSIKHRVVLGACLFLGVLGFVFYSLTHIIGLKLVVWPLNVAFRKDDPALASWVSQEIHSPWLEKTPGVVGDCTVFYAADDEVVLAGNNEDGTNPITKMWFLPAEKGKYGRLYFGYDNFYPQGGMNDQGLFFDATATVPYEAGQKSRPMYPGILLEKVMEESATVEEALRLFSQYRFYNVVVEGVMILIGDKTGASAVLEGDVVLRKAGRYQVLTNFRQSAFEKGPYPCSRFTTAVNMLEDADSLSLELFKQILDATHVASPAPDTQYSNIYDLNRGIVYLYLFHNYENVIEIHLDEELKKGKHVVDLMSLFPPTEETLKLLQPKIEAHEKSLAERHVAVADPKTYDAYVGTYQSEGMTVSVKREKDRLLVARDELPEMELFPQSEDTFIHPFFGNSLKAQFIKDEAGRVTRLIVRAYGMEFELNKLKPAGFLPWWVALFLVTLFLVALAGWHAWRGRLLHH